MEIGDDIFYDFMPVQEAEAVHILYPARRDGIPKSNHHTNTDIRVSVDCNIQHGPANGASSVSREGKLTRRVGAPEMSAHATLGFSLQSPSSRRSSTVPSKPSSSTLSLQKSISEIIKMSRQGSYQLTSPSTFSHCNSYRLVKS